MKPNYLIIPLFTIIVAWAGSAVTSNGMSWYKTINLPSWTPPGSVIGAVWTAIFLLATIAAILVWNGHHGSRVWLIFSIFVINAILNIFWSYLFFGQHFLAAAIWEAGVLGLSVVALIVLIWPLTKAASILLMPYAGWVAFATYLTYKVWLLNK
ncbi:MAG: TspO/MBR family protein [Patescibacteria group bacterium]|jgi:tryptophan-rich sensory protein